MTAANPDAPREFYGPAPTVAPTDPALDPPCTIRVQGGEDRATRYSPHAVRAVRTTSDAEPWLVVAGPDAGTWSPYEAGDTLDHDEVESWTVMPALFATTPWTLHRFGGPVAPGELVGDMDVEAFRG